MTVHNQRQKASDLAVLLKSGMTEEFETRFRKTTEEINIQGLAKLVNEELDNASDLELKVSQKSSDNKNHVSVMGQSRLFGDSWKLVRQSFSV